MQRDRPFTTEIIVCGVAINSFESRYSLFFSIADYFVALLNRFFYF
ncbi:hypothetical protein yfred0001_19440 [Yersinia frederiksenii ATCC 33641]|nr:hypothetical protein yfred0001_19440 [Yersinia frederiksenii ATCC 33641]